MNRARIFFALALEANMNNENVICPAVQGAIDRIVASAGWHGRADALKVLRSSPHYSRSDFCSNLLCAWKDEDLRLATGQSRDSWLKVLDASPDHLSVDRSTDKPIGASEMNNDPSWFHVFDATNDLWLQDDERSWGPYSGAVEFADIDTARKIALREIKRKGPDYEDVVTVLADCGTVELPDQLSADRFADDQSEPCK